MSRHRNDRRKCVVTSVLTYYFTEPTYLGLVGYLCRVRYLSKCPLPTQKKIHGLKNPSQAADHYPESTAMFWLKLIINHSTIHELTQNPSLQFRIQEIASRKPWTDSRQHCVQWAQKPGVPDPEACKRWEVKLSGPKTPISSLFI